METKDSKKNGLSDNPRCEETSCILLVRIEVNSESFGIAPGARNRKEILDAASKSHALLLEHIVNGKLNEITENEVVDIKGCEKFLVSPRQGCAS